jgi:AcrR family transcriptional regulator
VPTRTPDKADAILEAALELFAERGFHGTVVPAIADRAGVGTGTLYRYFEDKDAIVNALYRHWKGELGAIVREELSGADPVEARFERFAQRCFDFALANPAAVRFLETHHHQSYLDEESRRASLEAMVPAVLFLAEARAQGRTREAPPELLCALAWGGFVGVMSQVWAGLLQPGAEMRAETVRALWAAVARPGAG